MNTREVWKDIEDWEGYYQVSNLARVKSLERVVPQRHTGSVRVKEKIKSQYIASQTGYLTVSLRKQGINKKCAVHVLVAKAFVEGYQPGLEVNHEDGNKLNNLPYNLKWGTCQYNIQHAFQTGLNVYIYPYMENAKKVIDTATGEIYESIAEAGRQTGIPWKRLSNYLTGYRPNKTTLQYYQVS